MADTEKIDPDLYWLVLKGRMLKKIAVAAIKGGVGKSTITANLGLALKGMGYKIGFLDIDVTGSTLSRALGVEPPRWQLDSPHKKVIVPEVNGYWLLAVASNVGEDYAVMWGRTQHKELTEAKKSLEKIESDVLNLLNQPKVVTDSLECVRQAIDDIIDQSKWHFVSELLSEEFIWPVPLDYLIADLPPSTSDEMFSFLEQTKDDLFGVVIVSQPSHISTIGLQRTIDLLRKRQIPIIGLVANQDGFLNRHGEIEYQFLSPRVDLQEMARKAEIPFLISIPQTANSEKLKPYFTELAEKVINSKTVVLKEVTFTRRLKRKVVKGIARSL